MARIILFLMVIISNCFFAQTIIYVDASRTSGDNTGEDWANAYISFQSALDAAVSGNQIWVAKGTYKPSSSYNLINTSRYYHFRLKNGVAIYGGFAGTETAVSQRTNFGLGEINETKLSGDLNGDDNYSVSPWTGTSENCYHVFYHPSGLNLNSSAILDGFTLKGGNATSSPPNGGGMYNYSSSPSLVNLIIINNSVNYRGGGIYNELSSPTIKNVIIRENKTFNHAGGICNDNSSSPTIINSLICNNQGSAGAGMLCITSASPVLINVTICNNQGTGLDIESASATLRNCIVWGNTYRQFDIFSGTVTIHNSCYTDYNISGGTFSPTNCITTDPLFVDAANKDYRITGISPCADAGNDSYNSESYDIRGTGYPRKSNKTSGDAGTIDIGAYEFKLSNDPLPVELTSFTASLSINEIVLNWQTATEVNNYGFSVERTGESVNPANGTGGRNGDWIEIGFVQGSGNSNSPKEYGFVDENPPAGNLKYRLKQIDTNGSFEYYGTIAEVNLSPTDVKEKELSKEFALLQNYPNPFNPTTNFGFRISNFGLATLKVYDILGNEVTTLVNENKNPGEYNVKFDGSNLSSGIYYFQLRCGNYVDTKKFVMMK